MGEERKDKAGASLPIVAMLFIAALIVAYPLSTGPVEWAFRMGYLSDSASRFSRAFYAPLIWLMENAEWFEKLAEWYLSLWR